MAVTNGHEGLVHIATVAIGNLLDWEVSTAVAAVDTTACKQAARTYQGGIMDGAFSLTVQWEPGDAGQEDIDDALVAGSNTAITVYPEGVTASTTSYVCATALITDVKQSGGTGDDVVQRTISGVGTFTETTVAA